MTLRIGDKVEINNTSEQGTVISLFLDGWTPSDDQAQIELADASRRWFRFREISLSGVEAGF